MKVKGKKFGLLTIFIMMIMSLAGCRDEKSEALDESSLVFNYERLECMNDIEGSVTHYKVIEDEVYIYTVDWDESIPKNYFYVCNADGSDLRQIAYEYNYSDNEWLYDMAVSKDKEMYLLFSNYENVSSTYILRVVGTDGKLICETDIGKLVESDELNIQKIEIDKEGNIYLLDNYKVYILDKEYQFKGQIEDENYMVSLTLSNKGTALVGFDFENGYKFKEIDADEISFCSTYNTGLKYSQIQNITYNRSLSYSESDISLDGEGDRLYYNDSDGLYEYDLSTNTKTEIINWMQSNINSSMISEIEILSDDKIIMSYGEANDVDYGLYMLNKVDPKDVPQRETLTYASLYADEYMKQRIIHYNQNQDKYQILLRDYEDEQNPAMALHKDLVAGNGADIMDLSGICSEKYIVKGLFEDLYSYIENDSDIAREDFIENTLQIMETDGKLYHITPTFGVNVMAANVSDVKPGKPCTVNDVLQLEKSVSEDTKAFYMLSKEDVLSQSIEMNYDSYINWSEGTCEFDNEEFTAVLEYANTYPSAQEMVWDATMSFEEMVAEKKILFAPVYSMKAEELIYYQELLGQDLTFTAYPSAQYVGGAMNIERDLVIYGASEHKEGAWDFLKTLLLEDYDYVYVNGDTAGFSIRKDHLEEIGQGVLNESQKALFINTIEAMDHKYIYDTDIIDIVQEEASAYFEGQLSAQNVAEILQERVSEYMRDYIEQ